MKTQRYLSLEDIDEYRQQRLFYSQAGITATQTMERCSRLRTIVQRLLSMMLKWVSRCICICQILSENSYRHNQK